MFKNNRWSHFILGVIECPWTALSRGVKSGQSVSRPLQSSGYKKGDLVCGGGGKSKEKANGWYSSPSITERKIQEQKCICCRLWSKHITLSTLTCVLYGEKPISSLSHSSYSFLHMAPEGRMLSTSPLLFLIACIY